jgi:hypothetical protein
MTAYVEELGGRNEIAELIEGHFKIVGVLLPDDQAARAHGRSGQIQDFAVHRKFSDLGLSIVIMTVELLIDDGQAAFTNKPCGSSTNLAAMPLSNSA